MVMNYKKMINKNWGREFVAVSLCLGIVTIVFALVFEIWNKDFQVPYFIAGDSSPVNVYVKNIVKGEPWYVNRNAQYPFGAAATTWSDGILHLLTQLLLAKLTGSIGLVSWIYYFSTYLFVALFTYLSLRTMRLGRLAACLGGVIFAFLPFHYYRIQHVNLVDYSYVPILCSYCLFIYEYHHEQKKGLSRLRKVWLLFIFACCLLQGMSSLYFSLFGLFSIVIMELVCILKYHSGRTVKYTFCVAICVICGIIGTLVIDKVFAQKAAGQTERIEISVDEEEELSQFVPDSSRTLSGVMRFQLRPYIMFLPIMGHRISILDDWGRSVYDSVNYSVEDNYMASVGIVIAIGVVAAFVILLRRKEGKVLMEAASKMTVLLSLCFMAGGFTTFFGLVNPGIRSYNRGGVFIAFFALVIILKIVEEKVFQRRRLIIRIAAAGVFLMLALESQTSPYSRKYITHTPYDGLHFVISYEEYTDNYYNMKNFYEEIAQIGMQQVAYWNANFSSHWTGAVLYMNEVPSNFGVKNKSYQAFYRWLETQSTHDRIAAVSYLGYDGILIDENAELFDDVFRELCAWLGEPVAEVSSYEDNLYLFTLQRVKSDMGIGEIDREEAQKRFYELYALYEENK